MTAIVGLSMFLAAILILRAAKIGVQIAPPPWWASDGLCTYVLVPAYVALIAAGLVAIFSWLHGGRWRTEWAGTAGGLAISAVAFAMLWGAMSVWQRRVRPAAPVIPLGPTQSGPRQPPSEPPLKKAA
jgi:hypothetical protein